MRWDADGLAVSWEDLFGLGDRTWDQYGVLESTTTYGCPDPGTTYGNLFLSPGTYGDLVCAQPVDETVYNPPSPPTVPGGGANPRPAHKIWLTETRPVKMPQIVSVGSYALELPYQSHPAPRPMFSPLPAVCDCWNDEQDLADILHALGMG